MKATLSLAAIAAGLVLSNVAAHPTMYAGDGVLDVVGVWRWVPESSNAQSPLFEIRREATGELTARIVARSGDRPHEADVSFNAGSVCMVTEGGASFKGELSEDGSRIRGVVRYGNSKTSAMLERVEHRKLRRAVAGRMFAT